MKLFQEVKPGDLITAELMNKVMRQVEDLSGRVDDLEQGGVPAGRVEITEVLGARRVGALLEVRGKNFAVPVELNTVRIDGVPVPDDHFGGGNNAERLFFIVPDEFDGLPKDVTLTVKAGDSSDSITFTLQEESETMPGGTLTVVLSDFSPDHGVIGDGTTYDLTFDVTGITNVAETYDVVATVDESWGLDVGGTGSDRTTLEIPQADPPGVTRQVVVAVTVPPETPDETVANLTLTVRSQLNASFQGDRTLALEVGAPPPGTSTDVVVAFAGTVSAPGSTANGEVRVPGTDTEVSVDFNVSLGSEAPAGRYLFFASLETGTGWTVLPETSDRQPLDMTPNTTSQVSVFLTAGSAAATPDLLITRLEKDDDATIGAEDRRRCVRT